jgi:hypothetical protein
LERDLIVQVAEQAGFTCKITESPRALVAELAADLAKALYCFRCRRSGESRLVLAMSVLRRRRAAPSATPFVLANVTDRSGRVSGTAVRLQVIKELPAGFRLPGRQQVSEQLVYSVLASFLAALMQTGVAICGGTVVKPLAGRTEATGGR